MEYKKLVQEIQDLLIKYKFSITTAESCTGGLIASMITSIAGSSSVFNGAIVTYSNEIKEKELGVKKETLNNFGAVSSEVVSQMLDGVEKKFNAAYSIAVSGIAGPGGATDTKPVGTVVIGIKDYLGNKEIETYYFNGNRNEIQMQSAIKALEKVLKNLKNLNLALDK